MHPKPKVNAGKTELRNYRLAVGHRQVPGFVTEHYNPRSHSESQKSDAALLGRSELTEIFISWSARVGSSKCPPSHSM
jgi:hypothetical protein